MEPGLVDSSEHEAVGVERVKMDLWLTGSFSKINYW